MFGTKRQRRARRLGELTGDQWSDLPGFLRPIVRGIIWVPESDARRAEREEEEVKELARITSNLNERHTLAAKWLNKAEADPEFARKLDNYLRLPSDREEHESIVRRLAVWGRDHILAALIVALASALFVALLGFG